MQQLRELRIPSLRGPQSFSRVWSQGKRLLRADHEPAGQSVNDCIHACSRQIPWDWRLFRSVLLRFCLKRTGRIRSDPFPSVISPK